MYWRLIPAPVAGLQRVVAEPIQAGQARVESVWRHPAWVEPVVYRAGVKERLVPDESVLPES